MKWRRKRTIVSPKHQIWFAIELVAVSIGFIVLCAFVLFVPPMSDVLKGPIDGDQLLKELTSFILYKWPMIVGAAFIYLVIGLLMSHRLWGPLYGIDRILAAWKGGERSARLRIRKHDYLITLKDPFNSFLDQEEQLSKTVLQISQEIRKALANNDTKTIEQKSKELEDLVTGTKSS